MEMLMLRVILSRRLGFGVADGVTPAEIDFGVVVSIAG